MTADSTITEGFVADENNSGNKPQLYAGVTSGKADGGYWIRGKEMETSFPNINIIQNKVEQQLQMEKASTMMENGRRKMYLAKQKLHGHLVVQIKRITIIIFKTREV